MGLILNIDTATEHASVCLANNGNVLAIEESHEQKNHASFLQPAIKKICEATNTPLSVVDAIAVTQGPGSYTGLRVGMASAKGLCYAVNKPLILLNTLKVMAAAAIHETSLQGSEITYTLFCPMIDARRMEVFTAIYDAQLSELIAPVALVLNEESFAQQMNNKKVVFSGSGHEKFRNLMPARPNALFNTVSYSALHMVGLAETAFISQQFANLAYSEPFYLKEFFSPEPKKKNI